MAQPLGALGGPGQLSPLLFKVLFCPLGSRLSVTPRLSGLHICQGADHNVL